MITLYKQITAPEPCPVDFGPWPHNHVSPDHWDLDERIAAHRARITYCVEELAASAKWPFGIYGIAEQHKLNCLRESLRTYAIAIVLRGGVFLPIYDHWPTGPTFSVRRHYRIPIPPVGAGGVKQLATAANVRRARRQWVARFGRESFVDPRFSVLDELHRVVMIGEVKAQGSRQQRRKRVSGVCWRQPPDPSEADQLERRAAELEDEGAIENGWDNHSTADGLFEQARELKDQASCARYGSRLFP